MSEGLLRLVLAAAFVVAVVGTAVVAGATRRRRAGVSPLELDGLGDGVLFFSDAACVRCDAVRAELDRWGGPYSEHRYDEEPEIHRGAGVIAVPLVVVRDEAGREVARFVGGGSVRRLRRLLRTRSPQ